MEKISYYHVISLNVFLFLAVINLKKFNLSLFTYKHIVSQKYESGEYK